MIEPLYYLHHFFVLKALSHLLRGIVRKLSYDARDDLNSFLLKYFIVSLNESVD